MADHEASSPLNYFVGKGILKFKDASGDGLYRDLGNASVFECQPTVTKLDHFSSRQGVRVKDLSVVQEKSMSVRFTLDEFTPENLSLAMMGTGQSGGEMNIFDLDEIVGSLRLIGKNSVGRKCQIDLPTVSLTPSAAVGFISEGFATIEMTGDVTADDNGVFGTINTDTVGTEIP